MHIEERLNLLEEQNRILAERIEELERKEKPEEFVTPKQLAETMNCSTNTVYIKIRSGEIEAVKIGSCPKIPMSQFYKKKETEPERKKRNFKKSEVRSMKDAVFG